MWNRLDTNIIYKNMIKLNLSMRNILLIIVILIIQTINPCISTISDYRLCYDKECQTPISSAKTLTKYFANEKYILSFDLNVDARVFSKSAGFRKDLWGVEINGKRGYAPKQLLREKKIYRKDQELRHVVRTELSPDTPTEIPENNGKTTEETAAEVNLTDTTPITTNNDNDIKAVPPVLDAVSPSFEVIDGTTIFMSPQDIGSNQPDDSYATKILNNNPTEKKKEQPILSIQPSLTASKESLHEHLVAETGALPKTGQHSDISQVNEDIANSKADNNVIAPSDDVTGTSETSTGADVTEVSSETSVEKEIEDINNNVGSIDNTVEDIKNDVFMNEELKNKEKKMVEDATQAENDINVTEEKSLEFATPVEPKIEATNAESVTSTLANVFNSVTSLFTATESPDMEDSKDPVVAENDKLSTAGAEEISIDGEKTTESSIIAEEKNISKTEVRSSEVGQVPEVAESASALKVQEENNVSSSRIADENLEHVNTLSKIGEENSSEVVDKTQDSEIVEKNTSEDETSRTMASESSESLISSSESNEKILEPNVASSGVVDKSPEVDTLAGTLTEGVKKETILVPTAETRKMQYEVPETIQKETALPPEEIIEEASGTTETSVQLELIDTSDEKVAEELSVDLVNETTQDTMFKDDNKIVDDSQLDESIVKTVQNDTDNQEKLKIENEILSHGQPGINERDDLSGLRHDMLFNGISSFNEFPGSRNLLNVESEPTQDAPQLIDNNKSDISDESVTPEPSESMKISDIVEKPTDSLLEVTESLDVYIENVELDKDTTTIPNMVVLSKTACYAHNNCDEFESVDKKLSSEDESTFEDEQGVIHAIELGQNYWETLSYLTLTALTTLIFSLGYFYIENTRRDGQLIAKINKLERELLISSKECTVLDDTLKSTKTQLNSIEDKSSGSDEIVSSLKNDLELATVTKVELENQVAALEKDVESATEAGLELERMLRELLAKQNEENPLAKTIEDLQTRLDTQQSVNESLTSALQLKTQENESLKSELAESAQKCEQLELEITRVTNEWKLLTTAKEEIEENLTKKIEELGQQLIEVKENRGTLKKQLKSKEIEVKNLSEIVKESNIDNVDLAKLSEASIMKAEIDALREERDDLKEKLTEVEGAHDLLEEHMRIVNKEMLSLTDQVKVAMKEKDDAETRLEVLKKFFQEKEAERQKEEAIWIQKEGEASTTVEKMQILRNEIQNYKQQIETSKREILDQEKEYKSQIATLESKAHEQWVRARQSERRLEESKVESGQLRNRLTLIEKNFSDNESEAKTHRMESNGETTTSPQLFIGAETSSSPLMFASSSSIPPPYLYPGPPLPPYLTSHVPTLSGYDVGQRPPPLGGRLSSPPPIPISAPGSLPPPPLLHTSNNNRYDHSGSSPSPPISPPIIPHPHGHFRSNPPPPPPVPPFPNDRIPPIPPLSGMLPPPHLPPSMSWGEDKLSSRNNSSFHTFQREQHARDYKDISEESIDRPRRSGKL